MKGTTRTLAGSVLGDRINYTRSGVNLSGAPFKLQPPDRKGPTI